MNNSNILKLINNNKWNDAINKLSNIFEYIDDDKNLFHYACMRGNEIIINKFIKLKSKEIFNSDNDGNTGAHLLAINGFDNILLKLVKQEPMFLKLKNNDDEYIFNLVIFRLDTLKKILALMKKNNYTKYLEYIDVVNNKKSLILDIIWLYFKNNKYLDILQYLYDLDLNLENTLIYALDLTFDFKIKSPGIVEYMLKKFDKLDVNAKDSDGFNALIVSIMHKNIDVILLLLKIKHINVNYGGPRDKYIPLNLCIQFGLIPIINELIKNKNIDYNKKDDKLNSPIFYLLSSNNLNSKEYKSIISTFIKNSNLLNSNITGTTPLHLLLKSGIWKDYINILKDKNIDFSILDKYKKSPLEYISDDDINTIINLTELQINKGHINILSEKQNITLPPTISNGSEVGLFNNDYVSNILYTIYILKHYNDVVIPVQFPIHEKKNWDIHKILIEQNLYNSSNKSLINHVMVSHKYNYSFLPHVVLWVDKYMYYKYPQYKLYLKRALNSTKRFTIIKISIMPTHQNFMHANVLIYDKHRNTIVRFEPYGDWEFYDAYFLDKMLLNMFKKCLNKKKSSTLKYLKPSGYLDKTKFQSASLGDDEMSQNVGDPGGYCLAWCYWFVELKMLNPDIDERILVETSLNKILIEGDINDDNPLLTHIRRYGKHLDNEKNKILEEIGLQKYEMYKKNFSDTTMDMIVNLCDNTVIKILKN